MDRLDDKPVKMGNLLKVNNTKRKYFFEDRVYFVVHIQEYDGTELPLVFTDGEVEDFVKVKTTIELDRGHCIPFAMSKMNGYIINIEGTLYYISKRTYHRAEHRAHRNKEDIPQKGFWTDILD